VYTDCHAAVRESALKAWNEHWFGPNPLLRPAEIPKIKLKLSISACEFVQDEVKICQGKTRTVEVMLRLLPTFFGQGLQSRF